MKKQREVIFRYAVKEDVPLILQFVRKLAEYEKIPGVVIATEELLEEWMFEKQRAEVIFAVVNGKEVGFVFFYQTLPAYLGKGGIYIDDLYVDADHRGKGYGKALLKRMAEIALERDCRRLEWCCLNWNENSMQFYRSLGAIPMEECTMFRAPEQVLKSLRDLD